MKLRFQKDAIVNGINIVMKAVPSKTTMSILECILIDASTGEIKLTGNDMELGIETIVDGIIEEKGKVALDAKIFMKLSDFFDAILRDLSTKSYKKVTKNRTKNLEVIKIHVRFYIGVTA